MHIAISRATLLAIAAFSSGCATVSGRPPRMTEMMRTNALLVNIQNAIKSDCFDLPAQGAAANPARRNDLALAYMVAVDQAYYDFEDRLNNEARVGNFVATITSLGLATAGASIGGKTSQVLSAANTGIIGEREAFNKEFLFDQAIPALENQMRASRADVRSRLYEQMARGVDAWPTCLALQDLVAYEQAGTIVGALVGITSSTAADKSVSEAKAEVAAKHLKFDTGAVAVALRAYFGPPDDNLMKSRLAARTGPAMAAASLTVPSNFTSQEYLGRILSGAQYGLEQRALALGIIATETDPVARDPLIAALAK